MVKPEGWSVVDMLVGLKETYRSLHDIGDRRWSTSRYGSARRRQQFSRRFSRVPPQRITHPEERCAQDHQSEEQDQHFARSQRNFGIFDHIVHQSTNDGRCTESNFFHTNRPHQHLVQSFAILTLSNFSALP